MTLPGDCPLPWRGRGVSADKAWLDHLATSTKCVALNNTWSHAYFLHESRLLWTPLVYIHFNIKIVFKRTETPTALFLLSSIHALCHCKSAVNKDIVSMYPSAGSVVMRTTLRRTSELGHSEAQRQSSDTHTHTQRERQRETERQRQSASEHRSWAHIRSGVHLLGTLLLRFTLGGKEQKSFLKEKRLTSEIILEVSSLVNIDVSPL